MALAPVNAVIVGAGAGGGIVAKELAQAGHTVVLLERGQWPHYDKDNDDELRSQRTPALGNAFGPDDGRNRRVVVNADGSTHIVLPSEGEYSNNAGCVGGGTVSYGAMAWRFMPQDFRLRSTYGDVKDSTLDDWPISYDDLEPFYEKAEYEIGVSGDNSGNPFAPPRKNPYPMPAFPHNKEARVVAQAAKRMGLHPFSIPMLRNSIPYNGRPACIHMRSCVGFACPVNAKGGSQNTVIPIALATGFCQVRTGCVAAEIIIDDHGRARGVRYFDDKDRPYEQPADIVVVSASATETARLLLNSRSRLFPNGAGNNHDWVGRNLQGHGYVGAWGLMPEETYEEAGPAPRSPSATSAMATPAWLAAGCWPTNSSACPTFLPACALPARLAGAGPTRTFSAAISSGRSESWARSRRSRTSQLVSVLIGPSPITGEFPSAAFPAPGTCTTFKSANSSPPRPRPSSRKPARYGSGGRGWAWV